MIDQNYKKAYYLQKSKTFTHIVNVFAKPWSYEMAYRVGAREEGDTGGAIIMFIGIPLCKITGWIITGKANTIIFLFIFVIIFIIAAIIKKNIVKKRAFKSKALRYAQYGIIIFCLFLTGCVPSIDVLYKAIDRGNIQEVELLIARGVNLNDEKDKEKQPLSYAILNKKIDIAKLLIEKGADVSWKDKEGHTPLRMAFDIDNRELLEFLIVNGSNVNIEVEDGGLPLPFWTALQNYDELLKLILKSGFDINTKSKEGRTILHFVVYKMDKKMIEVLVNKGVDINHRNNNGETALFETIIDKKKENAKTLIELGADVSITNSIGVTPLMSLSLYWQEGYLELAELMIEKGADINYTKNANNDTPLHLAVMMGNLEYAEFLIKNGADLNAKNIEGDRPVDNIWRLGGVPMVSDPLTEEDKKLLADIKETRRKMLKLLLDNGSPEPKSD